jgi:hypothetical protein
MAGFMAGARRTGARVARTGNPSGHSRALAIDAARFHFGDGSVLDVLDDWGDRTRGAEPCIGDGVLRGLVCDAVEAGLFQIVITPHHNRAHHNHVHLEVLPGAESNYVR